MAPRASWELELMMESAKDSYGLLVAMVKEKDGAVAQALALQGGDASRIAAATNRCMDQVEGRPVPDLFQDGVELAEQFGQATVRPEHVVLAAIRKKDGTIACVLDELGIALVPFSLALLERTLDFSTARQAFLEEARQRLSPSDWDKFRRRLEANDQEAG